VREWLLDINVVSELARPKLNVQVRDWLHSLSPERTYVSVLTLAEIDHGIEVLQTDDPRHDRYGKFRSRIEADFAGRILPLADAALRLWGVISGRYRLAFGGRAAVIDTMLTATAQHQRLHLATRNVNDVRRLGWSAFDPRSDNPTNFPVQP
jgi:predicted nucleic acid-binding protein